MTAAARLPQGMLVEVAGDGPERPRLERLAAAGCKVTSIHPMFGPDTRLLSGRSVVFCDVGVPEASREARAANYDEALLLDVDGYVSEASGENIFIVSDGVVKTPPLPTILGGITRHAVLQMLADLGVPTREERITRDEVYVVISGTGMFLSDSERRAFGPGEVPGQYRNVIPNFIYWAMKGMTLPITGNPDAIKLVRESKQPVIGNLSSGPVTGALAVVLHVPVLQDGEVKYVLNAIFYPDPLAVLLWEQKLPSSWIATIFDRNHVVAARTRHMEKFLGTPASPKRSRRSRPLVSSPSRPPPAPPNNAGQRLVSEQPATRPFPAAPQSSILDKHRQPSPLTPCACCTYRRSASAAATCRLRFA